MNYVFFFVLNRGRNFYPLKNTCHMTEVVKVYEYSLMLYSPQEHFSSRGSLGQSHVMHMFVRSDRKCKGL